MICSRCLRPWNPDWPVAVDAFKGGIVCPRCTRIQRHLHRGGWLRHSPEAKKEAQ